MRINLISFQFQHLFLASDACANTVCSIVQRTNARSNAGVRVKPPAPANGTAGETNSPDLVYGLLQWIQSMQESIFRALTFNTATSNRHSNSSCSSNKSSGSATASSVIVGAETSSTESVMTRIVLDTESQESQRARHVRVCQLDALRVQLKKLRALLESSGSSSGGKTD